jgi:hypothetical protein
MSLFNPSKLTVTVIPPVTTCRPIEGRRYTLTHSDQTGQLFLSIGPHYDATMVNSNIRDEVIAEWLPLNGEYHLYGRVYISRGEYDETYAKVRFMIFQKELSLAIKAMVYGDQSFYSYFPWLLDAPIYIQFDSIYPAYNQILYYGTPRQYLTAIYNEPVIKTYVNESNG